METLFGEGGEIMTAVLIKASGRAMPALQIGGFSRWGRALVEDVDHNPLLATFVLSGNPFENL